MAQAKESVLRFNRLMEQEDRASLFSFSDDVTEVEPLARDLERREHRHNPEDHRGHGEKDKNTTSPTSMTKTTLENSFPI